jgi:hypothetical protein
MDLPSEYQPSKDLPSSDAVDSGVFCCGPWGYFRQKRKAGFVSLRRKQYEAGARCPRIRPFVGLTWVTAVLVKVPEHVPSLRDSVLFPT